MFLHVTILSTLKSQKECIAENHNFQTKKLKHIEVTGVPSLLMKLRGIYRTHVV